MSNLLLSHWPTSHARRTRASAARWHLLRFSIETPQLEILAVSMPRGAGALGLRKAMWEQVRSVDEETSAPTLVIGTFDSTLSQARPGPQGLQDLWMSPNHSSEEITFRSRSGNAARVDLALGTPSVHDARFRCEYDHLVREQLISDHSLIRVDLDEERIGVSPSTIRGRLRGPGTK
jgi:hypothetical protein